MGGKGQCGEGGLRSSTELNGIADGPGASGVLQQLLHWHPNTQYSHRVRIHLEREEGRMGGKDEGQTRREEGGKRKEEGERMRKKGGKNTYGT